MRHSTTFSKMILAMNIFYAICSFASDVKTKAVERKIRYADGATGAIKALEIKFPGKITFTETNGGNDILNVGVIRAGANSWEAYSISKSEGKELWNEKFGMHGNAEIFDCRTIENLDICILLTKEGLKVFHNPSGKELYQNRKIIAEDVVIVPALTTCLFITQENGIFALNYENWNVLWHSQQWQVIGVDTPMRHTFLPPIYNQTDTSVVFCAFSGAKKTDEMNPEGFYSSALKLYCIRISLSNGRFLQVYKNKDYVAPPDLFGRSQSRKSVTDSILQHVPHFSPDISFKKNKLFYQNVVKDNKNIITQFVDLSNDANSWKTAIPSYPYYWEKKLIGIPFTNIGLSTEPAPHYDKQHVSIETEEELLIASPERIVSINKSEGTIKVEKKLKEFFPDKITGFKQMGTRVVYSHNQSEQKWFSAIDISKGEKLWSMSLPEKPNKWFVLKNWLVNDGFLAVFYDSRNARNVYLYDVQTGRTLKKTTPHKSNLNEMQSGGVEASQVSYSALAEGFLLHDEKSLLFVEKDSLKIRWETSFERFRGGAVTGSMRVDANTYYYVTELGDLNLVDPNKGLEWQLDIGCDEAEFEYRGNRLFVIAKCHDKIRIVDLSQINKQKD